MARKRDRRRPDNRTSKGTGRRRAVPAGLGMALGVIAVLMILAFAAVKLRDCRDDAEWSGDRTRPTESAPSRAS